MKNKAFYIFLAFFPALLFTSCKKNIDGCVVYYNVKCKAQDNLSVEQSYAALLGTWEFQKSSSLANGNTWSRATKCIRVTYTSDSTYHEWIDGVQNDYKYSLQADTTHNNLILFSINNIPVAYLSFCNKTDLMTLDGSFASGGEHVYKRAD